MKEKTKVVVTNSVDNKELNGEFVLAYAMNTKELGNGMADLNNELALVGVMNKGCMADSFAEMVEAAVKTIVKTIVKDNPLETAFYLRATASKLMEKSDTVSGKVAMKDISGTLFGVLLKAMVGGFPDANK